MYEQSKATLIKKISQRYFLVLLMWFSGCGSKEWHKSSGSGYSYFRYVDDDSPPVLETYTWKRDGFLLLVLSYDTDGNWINDHYVQFSSDPLKTDPVHWGAKPETTSLPYPRRSEAEATLRRFGILEVVIQERLTPPAKLSPANAARFATPQYQRALAGLPQSKQEEEEP